MNLGGILFNSVDKEISYIEDVKGRVYLIK